MYTGGGQYWGDAAKFWGTEEVDYDKFQFPGITFDTAQYMVDVLNIKGTSQFSFIEITCPFAHIWKIFDKIELNLV